ncbi:MAG: hypothetical protein ABI175_28200, partial [Polyangiales bacterium]
EAVDSDGDGVGDMDELRKKTDPNIHGPVGFVDETEVRHGCQCRAAGPSTGTATSSLAPTLVAALAVITVRRASRRGRPSRA